MNKHALKLAELLLNRSETISTAESCTGGMIGAELTALAGSSSWYYGGVIAYDNSVKQNVLRVNPQTLATVGAVSEETALQMVEGVVDLIKTDWGISVTGIAGPGGGTVDKPVGLVYIGTSGKGRSVVTRNVFGGDRDSVRLQTVETALKQVIRMM